ncbi:MAG: hypothetical protein IH889_10790 [Planctomycetes bacterium]|nr:hypothetical protein [Planctomycetota bacterium]
MAGDHEKGGIHYLTASQLVNVDRAMVDAWDDFGQRWIVHHSDLLEAVVLLAEMLRVDWEEG